MTKTTVACIGLVLILGLGLPSWLGSQAAQELPARSGSLQYEVSVVLKLIHVYVTDKRGNPVENLTRDDFTLTDNGKPVVLTEFERHTLKPAPEKSETAGGPPVTKPSAAAADAPSAPPGETNRKFFLFFDFAYNNARGIVKAKKAALSFLDEQVRPDDEVGVLSYSSIKGLAVHEYLTTDHAKIRQVLDGIDGKGVAGRANELEDQYFRLIQEGVGAAIAPQPGGDAGAGTSSAQANLPLLEANALRQESKRLAQTFILKLTTLARALRLIPGQKQFIMFSTGIPSSLIYGYQAGNPQSGSARTAFDAGDRILRTQNEEMYKQFGAAGCTFYTFDTRETAKTGSLFAYDEQTFATGFRNLFSSQGVFSDTTDIFKDERLTGAPSLKRFSDTTGGRYFSNINMSEKNLAQVQTLTGTYYVLGYSIGQQWDGRFHEIKVEVSRPGCEIRAQAGYFNPKPYARYTDLEKELQLFDLALNEGSAFRMPVDFALTALSYRDGDGAAGLEMVARIPGEVTQRFSGSRVEFVGIVFDAVDNVLSLSRLEEDLRSRGGQTVIFAAPAPAEPGEYRLRLVARDMDSGMSAVASTRAAVAKPPPGLALSTPLLLSPEPGGLYLEASGGRKKGSSDWKSVYPFDRQSVSPIAGAISGLNRKFLAVVPFAFPGGETPDLAISAFVLDGRTGRRLPVEPALVGRTEDGPAGTARLELLLEAVPPGKYVLYVHAEDRVSKTLAHTQTAFVILPD